MSQFDLVIKYIKGSNNVIADAFSRLLGYKGSKVYKEIAIFKENTDKDLIPNIKEIALFTRVLRLFTDKILKA